MSTIERDEGDRSDADEGDVEDRAVILARRRALVATALCGIAVGVEGCDWLAEKLGAPRACLNVSAPQPCLDMPVGPLGASDAGSARAAPCLASPPEPLRPEPLPRPSPCLSNTLPRFGERDTTSEKRDPERKHDDGSET